MKILFVGLGSIGQRHLQNIKKIFPKSFLYALRKKNKSLVIKNTKLIKKKNFLEKNIRLIWSIIAFEIWVKNRFVN